MPRLTDDDRRLLDSLLAGEQRALARVISKIENRADGYRALLADLHGRTGEATVVGITGSPGAGKSTLVDKLTKRYRDRDETVGILAVDPSSPYTGGAVLGDRIRMGSTAGDRGVFIRSMSARGQLGGLSMATTDAVTALDAFGIDRVIIETVGAGQNEVDIVETADTVVVVVQPGSGDDVQLLKAGILEIGDLFVVNKADMTEAAQTVADLEAMIHMRHSGGGGSAGHHGVGAATSAPPRSEPSVVTDTDGSTVDAERSEESGQTERIDANWTPPVVETVATTGEGISALDSAIDDHREYLQTSATGESRRRKRAAATLRRLLRQDLGVLADRLLEREGGIDELAAAVSRRERDPYSVVSSIVEPLESALEAAEGSEYDQEDTDRTR